RTNNVAGSRCQGQDYCFITFDSRIIQHVHRFRNGRGTRDKGHVCPDRSIVAPAGGGAPDCEIDRQSTPCESCACEGKGAAALTGPWLTGEWVGGCHRNGGV